jgi:ribonuclease HI
METFKLYTDGACFGNPGPGGWCAVLLSENTKKRLYGYEVMTTNNRMELSAVIQGLKSFKKNSQIEIYTDSKYVKDAFTQNWIKSWQKNNWKTSAKKDVKNKDLWEILIALTKNHQISWHWVKGHSGDEFNDMCDDYAKLAINEKTALTSEYF